MEHALNYLLGEGGRATSAADHSSSSVRTIACSISQYSVDQGRSACTCIALTGAALVLQEQHLKRDSSEVMVTPELIQTMIVQGVDTYRQLNSKNTSGVEHMSAEEVLAAASDHQLLGCLRLREGGVRQGLLSRDVSHPLGLQALLEGCRSDHPSDEWMAVLITKTPETVVVLLPPSASLNQPFVLLDSHPRPQAFGTASENGYARLHANMAGLLQSLSAIFPPTDLGPDIPELMATMYNSFDLVPLSYRPLS